ncbi:MAG: efflux RND transporter periplasmic adaptor subunit [Lachnospiraceae bacterium]|jgi:multidrug efflux pump subunit AcrA (membrane-fusion protein)|nr:efflux RND transporter periplasmic adaptor subunit [Lachnospiraceae bacterium]MCH4027758.1 efflux RND transporter periplasmic adaptor subunit [Lachnospiraceae bacterium]MCH4065599.1 efflux RND transporter periplasmic adaptor subunit [Lachnospiraceae bacterium]MCH4111638.1 efflux RND transporter periplasmic adaptor subunit [Lachnospiraceae bacterium]MCI1444386.1 efflux RND transporter periplasmic adaptor subunit [Lachnospiraceae bacterium]
MSASSTEKILGKSKKKKSKKGLIIGISIAAAAAALLLITYGLNVVPGKLIRDKLSPAADTADETAYMPVTATAVVMDVQQKLTVTGKVISNAEQIENAHATDGQETTGYIVDQVNVKVGDTVKAGDVLYTIDMTKTENDITLNQKKLALQQQQNAIDENTASRQYNEAAQSTYNSYLKQSRLNEDAQEDTALAVQGTDYTAEQIEEVRQKMEDAYNAWQSAKTKAEASKASVDQQNLIIAQNEANDPAGYATSSQKAEDDAQLAVLTAQNTQNEEAETKAKDDYDTLKQEYSSFTTADRAQQTQLESAADEAVTQYETGQAAADKIATQKVTSQTNTLDAEEAIRADQATLENREVKADIDGIVTAVNVADGQAYTGTEAVVINNLDTMKATCEIPEENIADIAVGTKVEATTSATGQDTVEGSVCFTAPTPTQDPQTSTKTTTTATASTSDSSSSASSSSSTGTSKSGKVTYNVQVDLGQNARLRIGMTANLNFILKENKNCLAVPKDCISGDAVNGYFVTRVLGDGSDPTQTEEVMVEIGAQGDTYTAITSGNLNEGDVLIENVDTGSMTDNSAAGSTGLMDGVY